MSQKKNTHPVPLQGRVVILYRPPYLQQTKYATRRFEIVKRVFINGYGSIGSRLAAFLLDDSEIEITGIGKYSPDSKVGEAISKGLDVYVPESRISKFDQYDIKGTIKSALCKSDIVIDATPGGCGHTNKMQLYEPNNIPAIYQGGESVTGPRAVSDMIFNSRTNYDAAINAKHVMQGSCNVTGMGRILMPLLTKYRNIVNRIDVTLIRRWADMEQTDKNVPDTIEMTQSPHHGEDVMAALKGIKLSADLADQKQGIRPPLLHVRAVKVPTRQMHLHIMDVRFATEQQAPAISEMHDLLAQEPGIAILHRAKDTAQIRECAKNMGFGFTDTNLIHMHANMTSLSGDTMQLMYSDDQTGIVIPENHMLLQAMTTGRSYEDAALHTEKVFHMKEKKKILQETFSAS